jgi:hypothetical protein
VQVCDRRLDVVVPVLTGARFGRQHGAAMDVLEVPVSAEPYPHEDSAVTLGELARRLDELRTERTWRVAFWAALASGLALTIALAALVVAL